MYKQNAHIHFIGIGGIGMSGIAKILRLQGYTISGCDLDIQKQSVQELRDLGCHISYGNNNPACSDSSIDIVVYTSAVKKDNPEVLNAQSRNIPTIPRALMLAELMRTKYSIAISGSHGKTTTTSLVSHILIEAGIDPTVVIGGHLKNISTNARHGEGDFLVAEADESDRSLLHLHATLALITNIDLEHLETYTNIDDIKGTFKQFINNLPFYGTAFLCVDNENVRSLLPMPHVKTVTYGIKNPADYMVTDIQLDTHSSSFTVYQSRNSKVIGPITFAMLGEHNVTNCLGAIAIALELGIPFTAIKKAIESFKGIERRFCYKGRFLGAELFDDYGHHPAEIAHTLAIAQRRTKKGLTVIFQPHRYTRTHHLWKEFIDTFVNSDLKHLIITDIYEASEAPIPGVSSQTLVAAIQAQRPSFTVSYVPFSNNFDQIIQEAKKHVQQDDLLLLQGAGKLYTLAKKCDDTV